MVIFIKRHKKCNTNKITNLDTFFQREDIVTILLYRDTTTEKKEASPFLVNLSFTLGSPYYESFDQQQGLVLFHHTFA